MSVLRAWLRRLLGIDALEARIGRAQEALGRIELRQLAQAPDLASAEFGVYSQWGEDGMIQWLLRQIRVDSREFVEFGVGDYSEANTRFLLVSGGWSGLVIESSAADVARLRRDPVCWRHGLRTECAMVTGENIDALLAAHGVAGKVGLLSIDIDGNDYWVWKAIGAIEPVIVIVEYNARFGPDRAITIPYQPAFDRRKAHYSWIYYGASLAALTLLGQRKGYALVGCNRAGNNAFFVRRDRLPPSIPERTAADAFVPAGFREARSRNGALALLSPEEEARILQSLPVVDVSGQ